MKKNAYDSSSYNTGIYANPRTVTASIVHTYVENGTQKTKTYTQQNIKTFKIDSTPVNGKWFGISYSQQLSVTFIDPNKIIGITRGDKFKVSLICGGVTVPFPTYYADSCVRDEKTGDLSVIGFDIMAKANNTMITIPNNFSGNFNNLLTLAANALGVNLSGFVGNTATKPSFNGWTKSNINIPSEGIPLRDFITALCEISGSYAYINSVDALVFRSLTAGTDLNYLNFTDATEAIDKSKYFDLVTDKTFRLNHITHTNELNDAITVTRAGATGGVTQVLYDNPFLSSILSETDIRNILQNVVNNIYNVMIPYSLTWRGNPAMEIGDRLQITTKNGAVIEDCFYLSETLEYNGGLVGRCEWQFDVNTSAGVSPTSTSSNGTSVRAIVDKQNGKITLAVTTAEEAGSKVDIQKDRINTIVGDWGPTGTHSKIEQSADKIDTLVTAVGPTGGKVYSQITQTADKINTLVNAIGPTGALIYSQVEQTATEISSTVSAEVAQDTVENAMGPTGVIGEQLVTMSSNITQNADKISLVVTETQGPSGTQNVVNSASIVAGINGSGSSVQISANHINLEGVTTFVKPGDNISTLTNNSGYVAGSDIYSSGTTTIDGDKITANSITANKINTTNLAVSFIRPQGATTGEIEVATNNEGVSVHATNNQIELDASGDGSVTISGGDGASVTTEGTLTLDGAKVVLKSGTSSGWYGTTNPENIENPVVGQIYFKI